LENHRENADYSRLSSTERIEARERSASAIVHHQALSGQTVIFVNDINVTGAQQRVMRRYFEAIGVTVIHWIYIMDVAEELGRQAAQIEYDLNTWKYGSFDDFAALLSTAEITFTAKCIARVFSYNLVELSRLFGMLSVRRRLRILELTVQEERYGGDAFGEKIDLLRTFCSREPRTEKERSGHANPTCLTARDSGSSAGRRRGAPPRPGPLEQAGKPPAPEVVETGGGSVRSQARRPARQPTRRSPRACS
jgi:hypothetical protein